MARVIVFDAGVLIAHLEVNDVFHGAATAFLEQNEEFEFTVSPVTLAECLVRPAAAGRAAVLFETLARLRFEEYSLTAADAPGIAELRAASGLRMSDALVLYTAERSGSELVTTDRALARNSSQRGVVTHLLEPA